VMRRSRNGKCQQLDLQAHVLTVGQPQLHQTSGPLRLHGQSDCHDAGISSVPSAAQPPLDARD